MCYTLHRGSSYPVAVYPMPSAVYGFFQPSATFYSSSIAIYWMPHFRKYVYLSDLVTCYNTVFTSDTSFAILFTLQLLDFRGLKYTVQSSHSQVLYSQSLVLFPQSSKFCVDVLSACDASSSSSSTALCPLSPSYPLTSLVPWSYLSSSSGAHGRWQPVRMP